MQKLKVDSQYYVIAAYAYSRLGDNQIYHCDNDIELNGKHML